jgi:hypothetical protein
VFIAFYLPNERYPGLSKVLTLTHYLSGIAFKRKWPRDSVLDSRHNRYKLTQGEGSNGSSSYSGLFEGFDFVDNGAASALICRVISLIC